MRIEITCSETAARAIRPSIPRRLRRRQECFVVMCLDTAHVPIGRPKVVAVGTVNSVDVHPRDVFRDAVKRNAAAIIVAHNHPSGRTDPIVEDHTLTAQLVRAGELLGIPVLDHLVLAPSGEYASLADRGCLREVL